jgi:hypothetical protein
VRDAGTTGFVTVSGDRHCFWAGLSAKALPPAAVEPVDVAFITGSVSAPGIVEAYEHRFPKDHMLRLRNVFRARSYAARHRTAARSATASHTASRCGSCRCFVSGYPESGRRGCTTIRSP